MTMQQKLQAKKSKKGFTLVELVIVILGSNRYPGNHNNNQQC